MTSNDPAPGKALHGETDQGVTYTVFHDGAATEYTKDSEVSTRTTSVDWDVSPAVSSPEDAHSAARSWMSE